MVWYVFGYVFIGLAFALAASAKFETVRNEEMNFWQWCFCVFLWPLVLLASIIARVMG